MFWGIRSQLCLIISSPTAFDQKLTRTSRRHSTCILVKPSLHPIILHEPLATSLLMVSRQTYNEGTPIVWNTNTFAFYGGRSFESFVTAVLDRRQAGRISKIQIRATTYPEPLAQWRRALRTSILNRLLKVRTIKLFIDNGAWEDARHRELRWLKDRSEALTDLFSRFLILPSLHTTVITDDDANRWFYSDEVIEEKVSMIKSLQRRMQDPTIEERLAAKKEAHGADQVRQTLHELTDRQLRRT